ncbi:MAG TPA: hypothetical protein DHV28_17115 [Ignavibacteriales bacterium]|jgi:hypothetical protein|nr:hypothetical protein [Ignavibacteriales bacterium]
MKTLKFQTIAHKNYEVKFSEDDFFDHMKRCGVVNIPIENQIGLYINNLHERLLNTGVPFDSVLPQTIVYDINTQFKNRYKYTNEILTFNL